MTTKMTTQAGMSRIWSRIFSAIIQKKVNRYAKQEGIPVYQAAEDMIEGMVMTMSPQEVTRTLHQQRPTDATCRDGTTNGTLTRRTITSEVQPGGIGVGHTDTHPRF